MESGIITKAGKFIACDDWKHIATAYQSDTSDQFILCRNDVGYGGGYQVVDIVGELNKKMLDALFDFATRNGVILEDVAACGLEDELLSYSNAAPNKAYKNNGDETMEEKTLFPITEIFDDNTQVYADGNKKVVVISVDDYQLFLDLQKENAANANRERLLTPLALDRANCPSCQAKSVIVGTQCLVCGVFSPRK